MDSLTLKPQVNKIDNISLCESVDTNALIKLIHSSLLKPTVSKWKAQNFTSEKQQLTKYLSLIKHGTATVHYQKCVGSLWGRSNPDGMVSTKGIIRD